MRFESQLMDGRNVRQVGARCSLKSTLLVLLAATLASGDDHPDIDVAQGGLLTLRTGRPLGAASLFDADVIRAQLGPFPASPAVPPTRLTPVPVFRDDLRGLVQDPPIDYGGPSPSEVDDRDARDGPRIPEPMVFDLVRGLGARRGEFEINVLNIVPFQKGKPKYEWAPEVEWVPYDGLGVEFEVPIFDTRIVALKTAAQYTFGTALDDSFIHGIQGILYYDVRNGDWIPTALYLAGLRLDETWSLFSMWGVSVGPQTFPFADEAPRQGTDLILNLSLFANVTEWLVLGVETNFSRQLRGPSEFLLMPQAHVELSEHFTAQFGVGLRDDVEGRSPEIGFRIIWER